MNQRDSRLALVLLVLNITMILLGAFALAWQSRRSARQPSAPTDLALRVAPAARAAGSV